MDGDIFIWKDSLQVILLARNKKIFEKMILQKEKNQGKVRLNFLKKNIVLIVVIFIF